MQALMHPHIDKRVAEQEIDCIVDLVRRAWQGRDGFPSEESRQRMLRRTGRIEAFPSHQDLHKHTQDAPMPAIFIGSPGSVAPRLRRALEFRGGHCY